MKFTATFMTYLSTEPNPCPPKTHMF